MTVRSEAGGGGTPPTPGEARRQGLRKSRWVAGGVAVGAAALLTGVIAGVNGADGSAADAPTAPIPLPST